MSPTSRSITPRPEGACLTALLSAVPALAHAQVAAPAAFNTASWVLIFVAFCLALVLVRQSRARQAEAARADRLADELDRERALVETSPEAIICWDTGIGIPAEDHDRIFGRFERGHNAEARRSGAGLGLSLVQSFINLHRGDVALESEPGDGTKVVCCLPARRQDEEVPRLAGNG